MNNIKKPLSMAAEGAEKNIYEYIQNKALKLACQLKIPVKFFITINLIKNLIFQRFADILLVLAGFIEGMCHGWN